MRSPSFLRVGFVQVATVLCTLATSSLSAIAQETCTYSGQIALSPLGTYLGKANISSDPGTRIFAPSTGPDDIGNFTIDKCSGVATMSCDNCDAGLTSYVGAILLAGDDNAMARTLGTSGGAFLALVNQNTGQDYPSIYSDTGLAWGQSSIWNFDNDSGALTASWLDSNTTTISTTITSQQGWNGTGNSTEQGTLELIIIHNPASSQTFYTGPTLQLSFNVTTSSLSSSSGSSSSKLPAPGSFNTTCDFIHFPGQNYTACDEPLICAVTSIVPFESLCLQNIGTVCGSASSHQSNPCAPPLQCTQSYIPGESRGNYTCNFEL